MYRREHQEERPIPAVIRAEAEVRGLSLTGETFTSGGVTYWRGSKGRKKIHLGYERKPVSKYRTIVQ